MGGCDSLNVGTMWLWIVRERLCDCLSKENLIFRHQWGINTCAGGRLISVPYMAIKIGQVITVGEAEDTKREAGQEKKNRCYWFVPHVRRLKSVMHLWAFPEGLVIFECHVSMSSHWSQVILPASINPSLWQRRVQLNPPLRSTLEGSLFLHFVDDRRVVFCCQIWLRLGQGELKHEARTRGYSPLPTPFFSSFLIV
jgi:hypothetical protein